MERPFATLYLLPIAVFALSVTICEKFAWLWPWPLQWVTVNYKYASGKALCDFLFVSNNNVLPKLSSFVRNSQSTCAWSWPVEWVNAKYKYSIWKALCNFVFVGNTNVCPICHRLRDINSQNVLDADLWNGPRSNVNMPIERPHATFFVLAIAMFALSVTVCEILTVEMWMTLTLTFIWAKVRCKYAIRKSTCDFLCWQ